MILKIAFLIQNCCYSWRFFLASFCSFLFCWGGGGGGGHGFCLILLLLFFKQRKRILAGKDNNMDLFIVFFENTLKH